ncbi:MAG: SDR family oxidoreductase [Saprospiraceae bacterium]|nr:SDR family oxidoreductase [Saprospiraceae bacterium]
MNDLKGKVALITGGTKGIGYSIVESLLEQGMRVAYTGTSDGSIDQAQKGLGKEDVFGMVADVRDRASQQAVIDQVIARWGTLDVLVANAGVGHFASIEDLTPSQWSEVIDINLTGVFHSVQLALPHLKKSKGYILTIASLAGTNFFAGGSAYNASKFGLVGFTQAVMLDVRKHGIKTSTIMPGSVATYFNGHTPSEADDWKIQPEDLGQIVVDLLKMPARTLPSKIEVRPTTPPSR